LPDEKLPLAVIAEAACLQHQRHADHLEGSAQVPAGGDLVPLGYRDIQTREELLLPEPVLRVSECSRRREYRHLYRQRLDSSDRNILELVGDDVATCEHGQALFAVERF